MKNAQRRLIETYAREQMSKLGLHGWPHVKRVVRLCEETLKAENKNVDSEVLEAAALLHDIAKHVKDNNALDHGEKGAEMAKSLLVSIGFDERKIGQVCHAIRVHTHREEPHSVEAKILHDADFLDKMGCVGLATVFIKACLTDTTIEETAKLWKKESRKGFVALHLLWLKKPHFYTRTAQAVAKKRNKIVYAFLQQLEQEMQLKDFKEAIS